ncbi:hypothetical protein BFS86_16275 [Shewanella algae]|nr:hypothetical protein BFS86_16275 [Shewanella algae]
MVQESLRKTLSLNIYEWPLVIVAFPDIGDDSKVLAIKVGDLHKRCHLGRLQYGKRGSLSKNSANIVTNAGYTWQTQFNKC